MYPRKEHLGKTQFSDEGYEDLSEDPLHLCKIKSPFITGLSFQMGTQNHLAISFQQH